nr:hypothetical protein [Tanacetum cinerariifolium]
MILTSLHDNMNSGYGRDQRNKGHQSNRSVNFVSQESRGPSEGYSYPTPGECRRAAGTCFKCGQAGHLQKDCKKNTTASTSGQADKKPGASGRVFAITEDHATKTSGFLATIHDTTFDVPTIHDQPIVSEFPDTISSVTCKSCGKGAHYGYNRPPKVSIISNPEPCHDQNVEKFLQALPSFHLTCYSGDENSFAYDSTPNLVKDYPNVFNPPSQPPTYSYEFCGDDAHYSYDCPPQVPFIYDPEPCYHQDFHFSQNFKSFQQLYPCCENCGGPHETFQCQQVIFYEPCCENCEESGEFIKYSVENLIPNPSESEDKHECDVPICDDFTIFSNLLCDVDDDISSSDNELILFLMSSPVNSFFSNQFHQELKVDCDPEEKILIIKKFLYENSSPRPPKDVISENSDAAIKSFSPSPIPVEDSDSLMEEIDLSLTPDDSMPPGIENDDYESEGEILILEELLSNDSFSLSENESFHFDISSSLRPPVKPPDDDIKPNSEIFTFKEW